MWHATGVTLAQAPTPVEIRRGEYGPSGWDGELKRRNSNIAEENARVLSRQSSAQTPAALERSRTNPLEAHAEAEEEELDANKSDVGGSKDADVPTALDKAIKSGKIPEEEDDPFSMFVGRGRISSQVYEPKNKGDTKKIDLEEGIEQDDDDEADSLDELDPRPKKRLSALPKKFLDPAGDSIPMPDEKGSTTEAADRTEPVTPQGPDEDGYYKTGYKFPAKHTWGQATVIGLKAFWGFTLTPLGFLIVLYGLNVVAWGGMLFLLLIGGGKQFMCFPPDKPPGYKDCNDLQSPRRVWIEIDSQILNALFCVTGFGLIPWRFRDLYYLLQFRIRRKQSALRRLAGIHRAWFRLPGSRQLSPGPLSGDPDLETNHSIALPVSKNPDPPLTGLRAPDTKLWKLDYVIWAYVLNTFLQAVLSGFMWGLNRYDRPSWSTGLFVALACIVAALGGLMAFLEGKRVKAVEGIPLEEETVKIDEEKPVHDAEKRRKRLSKSAPIGHLAFEAVGAATPVQ